MQTCSICRHPAREAIDTAIIANESLRNIAKRFATSYSAVNRHKPHITKLVVAHAEATATSLQADIRTARQRADGLYRTAENVLACAIKAGDGKAALLAIRTATAVLSEARSLMELAGASEASRSDTSKVDTQIEDMLSALHERDAMVREDERQKVLAELQAGRRLQ